MEAFVTEGNVEIYLSRLHSTWNACDRDMLLRLLCEEMARMGFNHGHLENGERRVLEGRERLEKHRELVAQLGSQDPAAGQASLFLETLENTQMMLEQHLSRLRKMQCASRL